MRGWERIAQRLGAMPAAGQLLQLAAVALLLYGHVLSAPFYFDDFDCIRNNPAVKNLSLFFDDAAIERLKIHQDIKHSLEMRPIGYLSFAFNYRLHGMEPSGFRAVNVIIHILNAWLVFLLLRRLLHQTGTSGVSSEGERLTPWLGSLLFFCHPLQTNAVTFITQRFTSLVALFYLAAVWTYFRCRDANTPRRGWTWYLLSLACALLATKTKSSAFTLPAVLLLTEMVYYGGPLRPRLLRLVPYGLIMAVIPISLLSLTIDEKALTLQDVDEAVNLMNLKGVDQLDYLATQFRVIPHYLRLLLWPRGLNLDHDVPLARSFFEPGVMAGFLFLFALGSVAVYALWRARRDASHAVSLRCFGFGGLWFFMTIAMSSSIIPLDDVMMEYRVYLPSVGIILAGGGVAAAVGDRVRRTLPGLRGVAVPLGLLLLAAYGVATYQRNVLWNDGLRFRADMAAKSPAKARVRNNYGLALLEARRNDEALQEFREALHLEPFNPLIRRNLGMALLCAGDYRGAQTVLEDLRQQSPYNSNTLYALATVSLEQGDKKRARQLLEEALRYNPGHIGARFTHAALMEETGELEGALAEFRAVLPYAPQNRRTRERIVRLERKLANARDGVVSSGEINVGGDDRVLRGGDDD